MRYILFSLTLLLANASFSQTHTLNYFVQQAKDNSPLIRDYQNQARFNSIDSQLLKASLNMQVNFISNNSYAPIIKGWGYDDAITNGANVSGLFQVSRNFMTTKNIAAQYRKIALQGRALNDTIQLTQKDIERTVTEQYILAYGDFQNSEFNKQVYELLQKEDTVLKKLTQKSVFKQTDYLNFYVTLQQQELTYLQSQSQYATSYLTLNYLCGIVDTTLERLQPPTVDDAPADGFFNSVFLQKYVTDSLRLENDKALIAYEYQPKIGTYADAGYMSSMMTTPYKNFGVSVGLSLIVPIYDGHQRQMKYSKVAISERARQANKDYYLKQYYQQVALLRQQLYAIDKLVDKMNKQVNYTSSLIAANAKLLETGDIAMKDYVLSINNYITARNLLTQNSVARLRIVNQINYWNR